MLMPLASVYKFWIIWFRTEKWTRDSSHDFTHSQQCPSLRYPADARDSPDAHHQCGLSITTPGSSAAPALAVEPQAAILTYAVLTPLPAVPERQIPATPAVGPLSFRVESTVPTLRR